ncbi:13255_t:CDS:2, partial [Racocetra persica]
VFVNVDETVNGDSSTSILFVVALISVSLGGVLLLRVSLETAAEKLPAVTTQDVAGI